ncbi:hypothetical protein, variant [Aphanomyces astaci]|uniref:Nucleoporin Nup54 alpha-helical domain-containing protein n=1 Tax=Aphanomyces astaci TaxID=112090 RepID=W4FG41_APHAT|nr:hypothetical protein, variant [Aphanomyces astaci]ETV65811.1 hypothetical protein, variant [Aphanomyces astaci]|eukprot:XP_009844674.1 hypothetical protein, variant [Aphanomyces astaci]
MAFSFGGSTTGAASTTAPAFNFGSAAPAAATPSGFGFGTASNAAPAATTSGFGAPATSTGSTPAWNLGGSSATPAATSTPSFSFGGATTTPAAAPTSSFGFGSTQPATGFAAPASNAFSFGGGTNTTAAAPSTGFGGFGTSSNTQTSLFGKPATSGGFGSFGAPSGFGVAAATPAQPPQPVVSLDMRFDALPPDVQTQIKDFDHFLKEQSREEASIRSVSAQPLADLQDATKQLEQVALVVRNIQTRQAKDIQLLKSDVKNVVSQAEAADQIHIHLTSDTGIQRTDEMPSAYYWTLVQDFEQRMQTLKCQMNDVHTQLQGLQQTRHPHMQHPTPQLLQQILQSQNDAFMNIAAHVATTHEQVPLPLSRKVPNVLPFFFVPIQKVPNCGVLYFVPILKCT